MEPKRRSSILIVYLRSFLTAESRSYLKQLSWVVADAIQLMTLALLWHYIVRDRELIDHSLLITYYLLMLLVSKFTISWIQVRISQVMTSKQFDSYLLRPEGEFREWFGRFVAERLNRILITVPLFLLVILFFKDSLKLGVVDVTFLFNLTISLLLGVGISFFFYMISGKAGLYLKNTTGLNALMISAVPFLTGEVAPIYLISFGRFSEFLAYLPFRYMLSFPIEVMLGRPVDSRTILLGCFWLIFTAVSYYLVNKFGVRRYVGAA